MPDGFNPYDVELRCCRWLDLENGNTQATKVLTELFEAIHHSKSVVLWSRQNLRSLPPFVNKMKALRELCLNGNQLTTVDIKELPELRWLELQNNQLTTVDIKDLPALQELYLGNNQLTAVDIKDFPALQQLCLENNQLTAVVIKDLPGLLELRLDNHQQHLVAAKYRHAL